MGQRPISSATGQPLSTPRGASGEGAEPTPAHGVETADALRKAIDQGQAADKVDFPDPAAAPLGTDDEAAGHPPRPEQVRLAAAAELGPRRDPPAPAAAGLLRQPLAWVALVTGLGLVVLLLV